MTRLVIATVALIAIHSGCGPSQPPLPDLAPVSGLVTLDGVPVANALVYFRPTGEGQPSVGRTSDSGRYQLEYRDDVPGAVVGDHTVQIRTGGETLDESGEVIDEKPERIPARYNSQSKLRETVSTGENEISFELTSR